MIALLKGELVYKVPNFLVLDVNGVGYRVFIPLSTFYKLPPVKEKVNLEIYTHVREDCISLFGFLTKEEKVLFEYLISVTKIGPKLALNILSGISSLNLQTAIVTSDIVTLSKIPGIGRKTAERLVYELREKIQLLQIEKNREESGTAEETNQILDDIISALINLGYSKNEAERFAKDAFNKFTKQGEAASVETIIKESLKMLGKWK